MMSNANNEAEEEEEKILEFDEMGLDDRLLKGIFHLGWRSPTLIQERGIPLILQGKDLLARGRTGSGKTGAFAIPIIQKILDSKREEESRHQSVQVLILAPSRELVDQIGGNLKELAKNCGKVVRSLRLSSSSESDLKGEKNLLVDLPDILVSTPSRILRHLEEPENSDLLKNSLEILVIDEADLIFSFGYENDIKKILGKLPPIFQSVLTSATLSPELIKLKKLVLHNPVVLKLEEPQLPQASQLTQYSLKIEEEDKFVLIYALFKLKLIQGKSIIFVNNVDRCYKMKLYLEQFSIPVCVLNSELPVATRCHIVGQFNRGIYDVIVASDEKFLLDDDVKSGNNKVDLDKLNSKRVKDKESGVARGIDFQFVSNVINFDFPYDVDSYIHRVGRTARGNNRGTALSLISMKENERLEEIEAQLKEKMSTADSVFKPYNFQMGELDGFRYRARDAWRGVTKIAVREARLKEIKFEILNSEKLRSHFEDNPRDFQLLRHDKALHTVKHQGHLKNVPEYIVPQTLRKMAGSNKVRNKKGGGNNNNRTSQAQKKYNKRKMDPLLTMTSKKKKR